MLNDHQINAMIAEADGYTADGIFIDPNPTRIPTGDIQNWTETQRWIWWGRYYVVKRAEDVFDAYCFDGGCWDRATWRGREPSEQEAIPFIRAYAKGDA
ncbi:MAG: hypothetical protein MEQ74_05050 [Paracoccus sp.]|nr:hypothetical protein [Paracoccus sp. (in: a-proteobacteria)]